MSLTQLVTHLNKFDRCFNFHLNPTFKLCYCVNTVINGVVCYCVSRLYIRRQTTQLSNTVKPVQL